MSGRNFDGSGLRAPNLWDRIVGFRPGRRLVAVEPGASDYACHLLCCHAAAAVAVLWFPLVPTAVVGALLVLLLAAANILFAVQIWLFVTAPDRLRTTRVWDVRTPTDPK